MHIFFQIFHKYRIFRRVRGDLASSIKQAGWHVTLFWLVSELSSLLDLTRSRSSSDEFEAASSACFAIPRNSIHNGATNRSSQLVFYPRKQSKAKTKVAAHCPKGAKDDICAMADQQSSAAAAPQATTTTVLSGAQATQLIQKLQGLQPNGGQIP